MRGERSLLVCYDISNEKRLRKVERIVEGYGYRIQDSVFFCRSSPLLKAQLMQRISTVINAEADQFIIIDLGADENILDEAVVLGKRIKKFPKITFIGA